MAITTQRYFPTAFTILTTGNRPWSTGQAWVSGSVADFATCSMPSGTRTDPILLRGFNIDLPSNKGLVDLRVYITGALIGTLQQSAPLSVQLYNGSALIGDVKSTTFLGVSEIGGTATEKSFDSSDLWGTNVALTNAIIGASGFGIVASGHYNDPEGLTTGVFNMASIAVEIDYDDIAVRRNGGSTIYRLGGSTIKQ